MIADTINMVDGKQGLGELQATRIFTWEHSVSLYFRPKII